MLVQLDQISLSREAAFKETSALIINGEQIFRIGRNDRHVECIALG